VYFRVIRGENSFGIDAKMNAKKATNGPSLERLGYDRSSLRDYG
jgi:hypothetical protein